MDNAVPGVSGPDPTTYEQFWSYYLSQHLHPTTRRIHAIGTLAGLGCAALAAVLRRTRLAMVAPVLGYGPAWYSHFRIERNKPASFGHPAWSARADFRLLRRYVDGTLEGDVSAVREALGIPDGCETLAELGSRSGVRAQSGDRPSHRTRVDPNGRSMAAEVADRGQCGPDAAQSQAVSPTATERRSEGRSDLCSFLREGRSRTEYLANGYFATDSFAKRGGYVELLVKEASNLLATRSEILRALLRDLEGGYPLLERFDEARQRQVDILAQLDELTVGVGPRDVHQHQPERLVELVRAFRKEIQDYDRYEANDLVPFLEARLDSERLEQLGRQASKASKMGPTHAHPNKPPADERSLLSKRIQALYDRLRNVAEHPERTIQTGGEEGP